MPRAIGQPIWRQERAGDGVEGLAEGGRRARRRCLRCCAKGVRRDSRRERDQYRQSYLIPRVPSTWLPADTMQPITKRRIALLRSLGRVSDAVSALIALLDFSPTDAEAWAELADLYYTQGLYAQAIYSLEEVLVLTPNAWNVSCIHTPYDLARRRYLSVLTALKIHARLGEMQYMAATASGANEASSQRYMAEALKRFCRSIELCDDYLRGYYGLKMVRKWHSLPRQLQSCCALVSDF